MSQPVSHAPDIAPGLGWHEVCRSVAQAVRGLANALEAALDGITCLPVALERLSAHPFEI